MFGKVYATETGKEQKLIASSDYNARESYSKPEFSIFGAYAALPLVFQIRETIISKRTASHISETQNKLKNNNR